MNSPTLECLQVEAAQSPPPSLSLYFTLNIPNFGLRLRVLTSLSLSFTPGVTQTPSVSQTFFVGFRFFLTRGLFSIFPFTFTRFCNPLLIIFTIWIRLMFSLLWRECKRGTKRSWNSERKPLCGFRIIVLQCAWAVRLHLLSPTGGITAELVET